MLLLVVAAGVAETAATIRRILDPPAPRHRIVGRRLLWCAQAEQGAQAGSEHAAEGGPPRAKGAGQGVESITVHKILPTLWRQRSPRL
jgi:hypothetical protein